MPGFARREIVASGEIGVYHCMAKCVRRAFLCGKDHVTGKSFEHRKEWIRQSLERLAGAFAIDICSFAIMDNHLHVVLKQRPDIAAKWSAEDISRRWRNIFDKMPTSKSERDLLETKIQIESADSKLTKSRRQRLASISWFMKCLCEPIARRANAEENCKGRFWEGRFRSQALLDDAAVLACSAYVDLNPVRAKLAKSPESARFTSVFERIAERQRVTRRHGESRDGWLSPMLEEERATKTESKRASNDAMIPLQLDEYLELLDWTGRQIRQDKRGAIPAELAPILERLKLRHDHWVDCVANFSRWFRHAAGLESTLRTHANRIGRRWLHGLDASRTAFL